MSSDFVANVNIKTGPDTIIKIDEPVTGLSNKELKAYKAAGYIRKSGDAKPVPASVAKAPITAKRRETAKPEPEPKPEPAAETDPDEDQDGGEGDGEGEKQEPGEGQAMLPEGLNPQLTGE